MNIEIENELSRLCNIYDEVCLVGDFNSRTKLLGDYLQDNDYITEFIDDEDIANFMCSSQMLADANVLMDRASCDIGKPNNWGYKLIALCKSAKFVYCQRAFGM